MRMSSSRSLIRLAVSGMLLGSVAACGGNVLPIADKPTGHAYRETHPIKVASEQVAVTIKVPASGTSLSSGDAARLKGFVRDFVQRGRTVVTVESTQPNQVRAVLLANGLRDGEIFFATQTTIKAPNAVLSFAAAKAIAPECGDWSSSPTLEYDNRPHSNYGCAYQRNTAQTIANPADLLRAQPSSGGSASRTDAGILSHQAGTPKERLLDGSGNIVTGQ